MQGANEAQITILQVAVMALFTVNAQKSRLHELFEKLSADALEAMQGVPVSDEAIALAKILREGLLSALGSKRDN